MTKTKTRLVKGILIDPFACTVTEVEHDADSFMKGTSAKGRPERVNCPVLTLATGN